MKVLLSALGCEPGRGSEPEVGFRALLAAASRHEVWVLTAAGSVSAIEQALQSDPRADRVHIEGIPFGPDRETVVHLSPVGWHRRYDQWQRRMALRAIELDGQIGFDVVHHVTLASYWTRAGVAELGKPLVWGPIGGGVDPPWRLLPALGARGVVETTARVLGRPLIARLPAIRRTQRVAAVTLAQNRATKRRLRSPGTIRLLSNALAVELDGPQSADTRTSDVLFVGRLLPWKAPILALRALSHLRHPDATLRMFGEGPEEDRLRAAAQKWGLSDRVRFEGWVNRDVLLESLATAGVMVHPALHEEAGLCIAEALSLSTPVVCLDRGGPAEIVGQWRDTPSELVATGGPKATARRMAAAIDRFLLDPPPVTNRPIRPLTSFQDELLRSYELAANSTQR